MAHNRGLLRPTPTPQKPRQTGQAPLQAGAWSMHRGFRVGGIDSLNWDFVGQVVFDLFRCPTYLFKDIDSSDFWDSMEVGE